MSGQHICDHGVRDPHPCDECLERDIPAGKRIQDHPCYLEHRAGLSHCGSWPIPFDEYPYCERCGTELQGDPNRTAKIGAPLSWEPRPYWPAVKAAEEAQIRWAAPDLLEVLVRLDAMWLEEWEPPHVDKAQQEPRILTEQCLDIWRDARAAIAKATGVA